MASNRPAWRCSTRPTRTGADTPTLTIPPPSAVPRSWRPSGAWRNVGGVCSLGRYKGVANVFGVNVKGFLGWFLHRSYHLWAMPTIGRRVRIAIDWTIALLFPRDITQFGSFEDPRGPFRRAAGS